jgi:hypothetical protein
MGNSTSVYKAPMFITKGHFGDIRESEKFVPNVIDKKTKTQVKFDREIDDVGVWVEPITGTALEANQRLAFNFFIERDEILLTGLKETQPWLLPYTFVRREFKMNPKQIGILLGDLQDAMKIKLAA